MKRFITLLAWITANLCQDAVERVVEAVGLAYDDGYQAGRDYEASMIPARPLGLDWQEILNLLNEYPARKIEAIKRVRSDTGVGLREAKDLVDALKPWTNKHVPF